MEQGKLGGIQHVPPETGPVVGSNFFNFLNFFGNSVRTSILMHNMPIQLGPVLVQAR